MSLFVSFRRATSLPVVCFVLALTPHPACAADAASGSGRTAAASEADTLWAQLQGYLRLDEGPGEFAAIMNQGREAEPIKRYARQLRRFRDLGMVFWEQFPDDPRRYGWLIETTMRPVSYARAEERMHWNQRYAAEFKPAFLSWSGATQEQRMEFRLADIQARLNAYDRGLFLQDRAADAMALRESILEFAAVARSQSQSAWSARFIQTAAVLAARLFEWRDFFADDTVRGAYIAALQSSPHPGLRELGEGKARLSRLLNKDEPLELRVRDLQGGEIDLKQLRGKVVLIDFWSLTCSPCIDEMPRIRAVYERYHARGFEVVSIAGDPESQRARVQALVRKLDLPWLQGLQDSTAETSFWKRFQMKAWGEQFLIDRNGYLVANENTAIDRLEPVIRAQLGL